MSRGRVLETVIQINGVMSDSVRKSVQDVQRQFGLVDKKVLATAAKMAALATASAAAAGAMAAKFVKFGSDYSRTMNGVQAQTGATSEEMAEFGKIAQDIYASGKGEGMQEIADALVSIRQASGLAGAELKAAAEAAVLLQDSFGMETAETTRAATALMKNFGISAQEAYGLIAVGAQNGANRNGDLLDVLNEYSVHFKSLGMDSEQFMSVLINGAESGAFSIDKVADAVKEFNIRAKDGSKTSAEAYKLLGLNAEAMTAQFAAGGDSAEAAFAKVVAALDGMKDPVKRNAAGVALFGTMFEDLEAGVLKNFTNIDGAAIDAQKTLEELNKIKYNDLGYAITQIGRSFETALIPSAEKAGQAVYARMPEIQAAIAKVVPHVAALGEAFAAALPGIITWIGDAVATAAEFSREIADNWDTIGPIVYGIAGAFAAVKAYQFAKDTALATKAVIANTTAAWAQIVPLKARLVELLKDKVLTAQIITLYVQDAAARALTAAKTALLTAATTAWNVASKAAAVASYALGAALKFMTGPVGIVITAIGAAVAAGVALYKNWDTVKAKASELGAWMSGIWTKIKDGAAALASSIPQSMQAAFSGIPALLKAPVNAVISLINKAITAINGIGFTVPDWVPGMGGSSFSANLPTIPMLASGGFTSGPSIAGEAGTEAVISFDPAYRKENLGYLARAAQMLGVDSLSGGSDSLAYYAGKIEDLISGGSLSASTTQSATINLGGITFSPTVTVAGSPDVKGDIMEQLRQYQGDLLELIEELLATREAGGYDASGVF